MSIARHWKILFAAVLTLTCLGAGLALAQSRPDHFHHASKLPKVDYEGLFAGAESLEDSDAGRKILAATLDAYGGKETLETLKGFRLHYGSKADPEDLSTQAAKSFARGRQYRVTGKGRERILNGQDCWYRDATQQMEMDGGRYRAELFSYLTLAMPLAAETENFTDIRYGHRPDDPLDYLYFDKADSLMIILGLDPDDHRIRTSTGLIRQETSTFVFINEFSDYRQVEGFWFPHSLVNISMGLKVGDSVLRKVEVNPKFPVDEFLPEGSGSK